MYREAEENVTKQALIGCYADQQVSHIQQYNNWYLFLDGDVRNRRLQNRQGMRNILEEGNGIALYALLSLKHRVLVGNQESYSNLTITRLSNETQTTQGRLWPLSNQLFISKRPARFQTTCHNREEKKSYC